MSEGIDPVDAVVKKALAADDADGALMVAAEAGENMPKAMYYEAYLRGMVRALWSRCKKAEAERDARAEVGYAVEARALREQLATQRKDFEARLKAAEELAEILGFLFDGPDDPRSFSTRLAFSDHDDDTIRAALAQFRKDQEESK